MPIAFAVIGLALIIAGARGEGGNLGKQVAYDFGHGFLPWVAAIFMIGFVGYIPPLQKASRGLLILVILVYLIGNRGAFAQLETAVTHAPASDPEIDVNVAMSAGAAAGNSAGAGAGNVIGSALGVLGSLL